jgi:uncharacterized cupin superfamily protein
VSEATVVRTDEGVTVEGEGWFVVNLAGARADVVPPFGHSAGFERREQHPFPHFGINVQVLEPGQPNSLYHSETAQEAFLVLSGECILVVDDQERRLGPWDFFHAAPGTAHVFVGAGDGPCAILMVGARGDEHTEHYPVSEVAAKYGASVPEATDDAGETYRERIVSITHEPMTWPPAGAGGPGPRQ